MKVVLTIAGSDSSGGAGIQADLRAFQVLGVHGATVLTALTAQNTTGVHRVHRLPRRFVEAQLDAVTPDLPVAAAKTGMLDRAPIVEAVADRVRRRRIPNLVVDPVLVSKDGTPLLDSRGLAALTRKLLPQALLVTPNVPEAERLAGMPIAGEADAEEAARRIAALGVRGVVIKGGHRAGDPVDLLLWGGEFHRFPGPRIAPEGKPVRGTGCLYSAALAARIALGDPVPTACALAKVFVAAAIQGALELGSGNPIGVCVTPVRG